MNYSELEEELAQFLEHLIQNYSQETNPEAEVLLEHTIDHLEHALGNLDQLREQYEQG